MSALTGWNELDDRAVAYARALSADAVQKVGNGHPGTAMSLAPVAYSLFQRHLVHDPADPLLRSLIANPLHSTLSKWLRP